MFEIAQKKAFIKLLKIDNLPFKFYIIIVSLKILLPKIV